MAKGPTLTGVLVKQFPHLAAPQIIETLTYWRGNVSCAAEAHGVTQRTMRSWIVELKLQTELERIRAAYGGEAHNPAIRRPRRKT